VAGVTSARNVTSLVDAALTLQCPLAATERGDASRTSWQKRDDDGASGWRLLPRDGDRVRVAGPGSGLEFDRVLVSDAGFYRCSTTSAARGVDSHSTPIVLIVHGE